MSFPGQISLSRRLLAGFFGFLAMRTNSWKANVVSNQFCVWFRLPTIHRGTSFDSWLVYDAGFAVFGVSPELVCVTRTIPARSYGHGSQVLLPLAMERMPFAQAHRSARQLVWSLVWETCCHKTEGVPLLLANHQYHDKNHTINIACGGWRSLRSTRILLVLKSLRTLLCCWGKGRNRSSMDRTLCVCGPGCNSVHQQERVGTTYLLHGRRPKAGEDGFGFPKEMGLQSASTNASSCRNQPCTNEV